ncbi:hypothetical protein SeLEV6574_g00450 [Synchytrium endobioticum]|nr:hypothetical protein SeLEV6574_g00450 [Synchytrium endobioticum]
MHDAFQVQYYEAEPTKIKDARNRMQNRNSKSTQAGLTAASLLSRRVVDTLLRKQHARHAGSCESNRP